MRIFRCTHLFVGGRLPPRRRVRVRPALERGFRFLDVDVEQTQLAGDEVRVGRVARPAAGVDDVEAGVDERARGRQLLEHEHRRLGRARDGERIARRAFGRWQRRHPQLDVPLDDARADAGDEALEAFGPQRREDERGAGLGRGEQLGALFEAGLELAEGVLDGGEEPLELVRLEMVSILGL